LLIRKTLSDLEGRGVGRNQSVLAVTGLLSAPVRSIDGLA
jgi:hypothetical protein